MREQDEPTIYTIPDNFIDEGRIFNGMFKIRNFAEGAAMAAFVALFANLIPTQAFTTKITVMVSLCGPFFLAGVVGFNGDSLFQTIKHAVKWLKSRAIVLYNGNARPLAKSPIERMMEQEAPQDKLIDMVEAIKQKRIEKQGVSTFIEGVNFEFAEEEDLADLYLENSKVKHEEHETIAKPVDEVADGLSEEPIEAVLSVAPNNGAEDLGEGLPMDVTPSDDNETDEVLHVPLKVENEDIREELF